MTSTRTGTEQASSPSKPLLGRRFWVLWAAATVSVVGDGIYAGALPLLAARITHDPEAVSLTTVMSRAGWLFLGILSGVLVDRWSKTRVMWQVDALRAVVMGTFAVLVLTGHTSMALIYVVSLLLGLVAPFFENAFSAVLPHVVEPPALERANSWTQTSLVMGANLAGPPLGAALFVWLPGFPLVLEAASFAVAAALVALLRRRMDDRPPPTSAASRTSLGTELADGLRYLLGHRLLRTLAMLLAAINAISGAVVSLLVLYVLEVMDYPEAAYGWFMAVFAIGGIVGAAAVPQLKARLGTFTAVLLAAGGFTVGALLMGLLPYLPLVVVGIVVTGIGSSLWNVITMSLRQRIVPSHMLGRVTGVYRMLGLGAIPFGAAAGGVVAQATNVQVAYVVAGLVVGAATIASVVPLRTGLAELPGNA
ncbi:MAG: MFS transporter [Nocardioidaceae bacterium]